ILHEISIANALGDSFNSELKNRYRVLSRYLGWTTAKMAERIYHPAQPTIAFLSPYLREAFLDQTVDIEAVGPLHFLNQRDPVVSAQMLAFAQLYEDGPVHAYLLPQALLELKVRLSFPAKTHLILDSGLHSKVYHDEVFSLFNNDKIVDIALRRHKVPKLAGILATQLEEHGLDVRLNVSNEELDQVLRNVWRVRDFRP